MGQVLPTRPLGDTGFVLHRVSSLPPCRQPCSEVYAYLFRGRTAEGQLSYMISAEVNPVDTNLTWTLVDKSKATSYTAAADTLRRRYARLLIK